MATSKPVAHRYPELMDQYQLRKTIGSGGFAKVKLATHLITGEQVAIKIMDKKALKGDLPRVNQEIEALKSLSHPNICKLYQVLESETHYFLVMEYCVGGELFDHIVEKEKLDEEEARVFFRQIVNAVAYCHREGFTHRDLKPENILLDHEQNLKLVDFGLCVRPVNDGLLYTSCGSPNYAAPELIRGDKYMGPQVDIWSLGVLLYALLCGNLPFEDDTTEKLYRKILRGCYDEPVWLSTESRQILARLLQVKPERRISTEELCSHPWVVKGVKNTEEYNCNGKENLERDAECLQVLAQYQCKTMSRLWTELQSLRYDYTMATYIILLLRKRRGKSLRLLKRPILSTTYESGSSTGSPQMVGGATFVVERAAKSITPKVTKRTGNLNGKRQRIRSPGLDDRDPIPAKRLASANRTPQVEAFNSPPVSSCESSWLKTPRSARRMLNGLERRVRLVLTPRRSLGRDTPLQPTFLASTQMCNVTGTSSTSPDATLAALQKALRERGIECSQRGFTLRGKMKGPDAANEKSCKLSFELEICWIPKMSMKRRSKGGELDGAVVGIRRKRLKGDAWLYKSICEEVLAVAAAC